MGWLKVIEMSPEAGTPRVPLEGEKLVTRSASPVVNWTAKGRPRDTPVVDRAVAPTESR
jgi:hypothetical protein